MLNVNKTHQILFSFGKMFVSFDHDMKIDGMSIKKVAVTKFHGNIPDEFFSV